MKKLMTVVMATLATATAMAANITIFDGQSDKSHGSWYGTQEDQEIEYSAPAGQQWDIEGLFLKGTMFSMVGGYDFMNAGQTYPSGHVFFNVDNQFNRNATVDLGTTDRLVKTVKNVWGYDYAVDLLNGDVYDLNLDADKVRLYSGYLRAHDASNPWRVKTGTLLADKVVVQEETGLTDAQTGFKGDANGVASHFRVSFDLSTFLSDEEISGMFVHFTYKCGNDVGEGQVPDGGLTVLLLGLGLAGVAMIGRKLA